MPEESSFRFYPLLFLTDVNVIQMDMHTTFGRQCRAIYLNLLFHSWIEGSLPDDDEYLKGLSGNPKDWDKIWQVVGRCFKSKKGKLSNKRLEKERQKLNDWRDKSRQGGLKSGVIRGEKPLKGGSTVVQPKGKGGSIKAGRNLEAYRLVAKGFHDNQSIVYPNDSCFNNRDKLDNEGAVLLERFVRIDQWFFEDITKLLEWILVDSFWSKQIRSLRSIRNRSENSSMKFENARASMLASPEVIEDRREKEYQEEAEKEQTIRRKKYEKWDEEAAPPEEFSEEVKKITNNLRAGK